MLTASGANIVENCTKHCMAVQCMRGINNPRPFQAEWGGEGAGPGEGGLTASSKFSITKGPRDSRGGRGIIIEAQ